MQQLPKLSVSDSLWPTRLKDLVARWRTAATESDRNQYLEELWALLNVIVYRFLVSHAWHQFEVSREDLLDIASEKSLALIQRLLTSAWPLETREDDELRSFLSHVARNGLIDLLRKEESRRKYLVPDGVVATRLNVSPESSDARVRRSEYLTALRSCVRTLRPKTRRMWLFRVMYEMSSVDIGAHPDVQLKPASVDVTITRARQRIRDCLLRKGFSADDTPPGTFAALWNDWCNRSRSVHTAPDDRAGTLDVQHLTEDEALDTVLGDVTSDQFARHVAHLSACQTCEDLVIDFAAAQARIRSRPVPSLLAKRTVEIVGVSTEAATADRTPRAPMLPRRWRRLAASCALAASLAAAAVIWHERSQDASLNEYLLPVSSTEVFLRSPVDRDGSRLTKALLAYRNRDLAQARTLLEASTLEGTSESIRQLYLISTLLAEGEHHGVDNLFAELRIETLPEPWRRRARWLLYLYERDVGATDAANRILELLGDAPGEIGRRARAAQAGR